MIFYFCFRLFDDTRLYGPTKITVQVVVLSKMEKRGGFLSHHNLNKGFIFLRLGDPLTMS